MVQKNKLLPPHGSYSAPCPCGKSAYPACCQPFHLQLQAAPTAEALMRSRYSAYALGLSSYVLSTWHESTRPNQLDLQGELALGKWLGLSVKGHWPQGNKAEVEFVARYKPNQGPASRLHERSRFVLENGHWYYVDGDIF
jgi:SEC-C motif-containing protein